MHWRKVENFMLKQFTHVMQLLSVLWTVQFKRTKEIFTKQQMCHVNFELMFTISSFSDIRHALLRSISYSVHFINDLLEVANHHEFRASKTLSIFFVFIWKSFHFHVVYFVRLMFDAFVFIGTINDPFSLATYVIYIPNHMRRLHKRFFGAVARQV